MPIRRVLIVVDDPQVRWSLRERLMLDGHRVLEAASAAEAVEIAGEGVDLVLLDDTLPDGDGVSVLQRLRDIDPDALVMMTTAPSSTETVDAPMNAGAFDYVVKPFDLDDIAVRVTRALEITRTLREWRTLRDTLARPFGPEAIIGESEVMQRVKTVARKMASSPGSTVLITGERGTGKDLVAKLIHYSSSRSGRPFLKVACSALPEPLLESELFGHERGASPDAHHQKRGLFEQADEGTAFLDEIGEMTPALQARLLRVLEDKAFRRVGGTGDIPVDVRVVAATNRDLESLVKEGKFREDLYYRLNVLRIELPPLRARGQDVLLLARHFIAGFSREFNRPVRGWSAATEDALSAYGWPGNVRELRNLIERAVLLSDSEELTLADFASVRAVREPVIGAVLLPPAGLDLVELEKDLVRQALERTGGNQTKAGALLGLHRDQIRYRIAKFGWGRRDSPLS